LAHPASLIMFSFRYTNGVCKHKKTILSYRESVKIWQEYGQKFAAIWGHPVVSEQ